MAMQAEVASGKTGELLARLGGVAAQRGLGELATRLARLGEHLTGDLMACERALASVPRRDGPVAQSALHLLDLGGKRLRPLCVALASRVGSGFSPAARELAVAVELVHSATLLHDDVVDLGDIRRNVATARAVYGNAASIFAGDWLLVEALRRVRVAGVPGVLDRLLAVIEEMIFAESLQLEARGRIQPDRAIYFRIIEGKTAALFRWAMLAGARAGGLGDDATDALESYGRHLGVAFQAVDDMLDLTGSAASIGKNPFADLREGKLTYPIIVAAERDPSLLPALEALAAEDGEATAGLVARVLGALASTGGLDECRALARRSAAQAIAALDHVPAGRARDDLETIAEATVSREY